MKTIIAEIKNEIQRAEKKHGNQKHLRLVTMMNRPKERRADEYEIPTAIRAQFLCDVSFKRKEMTHAHIIVEEVAEFIDAENITEQRKELIQIAATVINAITAIDFQLNNVTLTK